MSALTYQEQSLINSLDTRMRELTARIEQMQADIKLAGDIAVDLKLIAVTNGGPLDKQVEQAILKGQQNNGN